jgi:seryl-tRNA synthetase
LAQNKNGMLNRKFIKENPDFVIDRLKIKNFDAKPIIDKILEKEELASKLRLEVENNNAEINSISKKIGELYKSGNKEEAEKLKETTTVIKEKNKQLNDELNKIEKEIFELLIKLPNIPHESVPGGTSEKDNEIVKVNEIKRDLPQNILPHWELAKKYGLIDFELGSKLTGSGFPVFMNDGAVLVRALINFFLDEAKKEGYNEFIPPYMVNEDTAFGTGQLPDKEGQMYHITQDNFYLVPTAEVPLTNIFRDAIIDEKDLPIKLTAYTPCFRREAGSYGKDVKGLNRVHQFDKVEIVQIAHPDKSYDVLNEMVKYVESLLIKLGLPYRIVKLCGGDLSFTSALTYDFEVYSPGQDKWLEVSSVSNFETFQSNRLKLRIKTKDKKKILAHTLNGSALALPRIIAAIMENYQTTVGIKIPDILVEYTNFDIIKPKNSKKNKK